jgi:hypothetical protein
VTFTFFCDGEGILSWKFRWQSACEDKTVSTTLGRACCPLDVGFGSFVHNNDCCSGIPGNFEVDVTE